jgi:para-nitrobenzyl esterase
VSTILADENTGGYTPDVDGRVLVRTLRDSFDTGQFNRVPVIDGTNHDEWRLFVAVDELSGNPVTAANYQAMIAGLLGVPPSVAAAVVAQYPLSAFASPSIAFGAVGTDAIFACNAITLDHSLAHFVPTFAYEFNDENAPQPLLPPVSFPYGAAHASELQYLFQIPTTFTPAQQRLSATMQRYWTGFAARGFPSVFWPPFNGTSLMQSLVPPRPNQEANFATVHHCAFWQPLIG